MYKEDPDDEECVKCVVCSTELLKEEMEEHVNSCLISLKTLFGLEIAISTLQRHEILDAGARVSDIGTAINIVKEKIRGRNISQRLSEDMENDGAADGYDEDAAAKEAEFNMDDDLEENGEKGFMVLKDLDKDPQQLNLAFLLSNFRKNLFYVDSTVKTTEDYLSNIQTLITHLDNINKYEQEKYITVSVEIGNRYIGE